MLARRLVVQILSSVSVPSWKLADSRIISGCHLLFRNGISSVESTIRLTAGTVHGLENAGKVGLPVLGVCESIREKRIINRSCCCRSACVGFDHSNLWRGYSNRQPRLGDLRRPIPISTIAISLPRYILEGKNIRHADFLSGVLVPLRLWTGECGRDSYGMAGYGLLEPQLARILKWDRSQDYACLKED